MRKLLTAQEMVGTVAARWKLQYYTNSQWGSLRTRSSKDVYEQLAALPSSATPEDVAAIIGNHGWTSESGCQECGADHADVLIGQEPDYESATVYLCAACLRRAAELVDEAQSITK